MKLFRQHQYYKYLFNFERGDIETIIDDQIVPINIKIPTMILNTI